MAKTLQFRRGTTSEINALTGAVGELFVDTTKNTVVVQNGTTAGGFPLAKESALTSGLAAKADTSALTSGLAGKQNTLVSGSSIKTINNQSLLGAGNITISGGSGGGDLTQVSTDITPLFNDVYDLGSTTNRFYDAYLGNKIDINGATVAGSMTGSEGSTTSTTRTTADTITALDVSGGSMGFYMTISNSSTQPQYPNGTVLIYTAGSASVAKLQAIPVGTVLSLYDESNAFVRTVTTTGSAIARWDNSGMMIPTSATSPTFLGMNGGTKISYSNTITTTTVIPDTREWTLASNASLVAPEVIADIALLGTNLIEADTITPEHILGAYTDQKGTLVIDGSLKVADNLKVRNSVTLRQETVVIGKVVSKSVIPSSISTVTVNSDNIYNTFAVTSFQFTSPGQMQCDGGYYIPASNSTALTAKGLGVGSTIKLVLVTNPNYTWTIQLTSIGDGMMNTYFSYSLVSDTGGFGDPYNYFSTYPWGHHPMYSGDWVNIVMNLTIPAKYELVIDNGAVPFVSSNSLLINDLTTAPPVTTVKTINCPFNTTGWVNAGNGDPGYYRFDWNNNLVTGTPTDIMKTIMAIFSTGSTVTIIAQGYGSGIYLVSNAGYSYSMYSGTNGGWQFQLTFVGGATDVVNTYGFNTSMSGPSGTINVSASVTTIVNFTDAYMPQLISSVVGINKYTSTSPFTWATVGDKISYIPATADITFKKNDGTAAKAITYDNKTGNISYDGLVMSITKNAIGDIYSSDALTITPSTSSGYQSIAIGKNALASTAGGYSSSVAIGNGATAGGSAVNIGGGNAGNESVSIIGQAYSGAVSIKGNAQGYGALAIGHATDAINGGIAFGYNASSAANTHVIFGHNYSAWSSELSVINPQINSSANTKTYYSLNSSDITKYGHYALNLNSITNTYQNTVATLEVDTIIKATSNTTQWQLYRSKYVVYHSASYVWQLTQVEAPVLVASGSGISGNGWTIGMELYNNTHLAPTVTSIIARTTAIRTTIKVRNLTA